MQPDTVVSSLAALLTRLTHSGARWWMLPAAGLATLRRGPCSWTWALNSSFEGLSSEALKSNCFDRPGSHSHQPGENLMISIFIRTTYIKKGPSAVPLSTPLCLHPPPPQTASLLSVILKVVFVPAFHSQWVKRHGITPTPSTCGSIPDRKILFLSQVTHTGFSYLIQWSSITRVQMILISFHGLLKWAETGKWELLNNWKKMKKELACWMLNKAEGASLCVHFTYIFKKKDILELSCLQFRKGKTNVMFKMKKKKSNILCSNLMQENSDLVSKGISTWRMS